MEMSHGFEFSFMKFSKFLLYDWLLTDQHMDVNALWKICSVTTTGAHDSALVWKAESDVDELVLLIKMIFILFNHQHQRSSATNEKIAQPLVTQ